MKEIIKNNFKVIITAIAADGLDESWLGKEINDQTLQQLQQLHTKNKINIAGEGGNPCIRLPTIHTKNRSNKDNNKNVHKKFRNINNQKSGATRQMTTVMCFGTFDLLHIGHLNYFKQAKQHGDKLIIVIARDKTKQEQNKNIIFTETERKELISALNLVDETVLGYKDDHFKIIQEKNPDIIFLGYDHPNIEPQLNQKFPNIKILRGKPYGNHKSTKIREKIFNNI